MDADRIFHAVERVGGADAKAPPVKMRMSLAWSPEGVWSLVGEHGEEVASYPDTAVRLSIQWKCRGADLAAQDNQDNQDSQGSQGHGTHGAHIAPLSRESALEMMEHALRLRGILTGGEVSKRSLSMMIMRSFIPFPAP